MSQNQSLPGLGPATKLGGSKKRKLASLATGGVAASATMDLIKKHKPIQGYGTDQGLYAHPFPEVGMIQLKQAVVSYPNTTNPKVTIQCSTNECIRFPEGCLMVDFTFTRHNDTYDANAANGDARFQNLNLEPNLLDPNIWINPHLNAATFFARTTVSMDNQNIPGGDMSSLVFQYNLVNKIMTTDEVRRKKYGSAYLWPSNTSELATEGEVQEQQPTAANGLTYIAPVDIYRHPNLAACQDVLTMTERGNTVCTMNGCLEGTWPLSTQCNGLLQLNSVHNGPSFLRPGVTIDISLEQRAPLSGLIERADVTDDNYFHIADLPVTVAIAPYDITIKKITVLYESMTLHDPHEVARLENSILDYPVDVPHINNNDLMPGISQQSLTVSIPRGAKIVYLFFTHEVQKMHGAAPNSALSGRFTIPPGLSEIHLDLVGRDDIVLKQGFVGLDKPRSSHSLRAFHTELIKKGLYSKDYDTWMPPTGLPYDFILPIDLSPYHKNLQEISTMTVRLTYTTPSRPRWSLRSIAVVQRVYSWDSKNKWSWRDKI